MRVADCHTHWITKPYFNLLEKLQTVPRIERTSAGRVTMIQRGFSLPVTPNFLDMDLRLKEMEKSGVQFHLLSLVNPWVDFLDSKLSMKIAKESNDELSKICQGHPDKFAALATLPYGDEASAIEELDRSVQELGLKGAIIGSNLNGRPIHAKQLWPIYERISALGVPLFIHPTAPVIGQEFLTENFMLPTIGFMMDTAVAVVKMIYAGVLDKIPHLKIICAHLGGFLPFLAGRLDSGYLTFPGVSSLASNQPSYYLRRMYFDAVTYVSGVKDHALALECARSLVGADRLLFGSDYPFALGDAAAGIKMIGELNISQDEKDKILSRNMAELFEMHL